MVRHVAPAHQGRIVSGLYQPVEGEFVKHKTCALLPPMAIQELQRAAQTPITSADPLARIKAIEKVSAKIKRNYPQYYNSGAHDGKKDRRC